MATAAQCIPAQPHRRRYSTVTLVIFTSDSGTGLSFLSQRTASMSWMTFMPPVHRPKMVCLLSSQGVGTTVMKNCDCVERLRSGRRAEGKKCWETGSPRLCRVRRWPC